MRARPGPAGDGPRAQPLLAVRDVRALRDVRTVAGCRVGSLSAAAGGVRDPGEHPVPGLLEQVAAHTQTLTVVVAGGATTAIRFGVVDLAHDSIAPRRTAGDIAPADHACQPVGEGPRPRLHGDQLPGAGARVQAPVEGRELCIGMRRLRAAQAPRGRTPQGVGDDMRRNRPIPLELSAFGVVAAAEQSGVGDDDPDVQSRGAAGPFPAAGGGPAVHLRGGRSRRGVAQNGVHQEIRLERPDRVAGTGGPPRFRPALESLHHPGGVDATQHRAHPRHAVIQRRHGHVAGSCGTLGPIP